MASTNVELTEKSEHTLSQIKYLFAINNKKELTTKAMRINAALELLSDVIDSVEEKDFFKIFKFKSK